MRKLWERLKNAAGALAGRTSAPAPAGGVKKPQLKAVKGGSTKSGFSASAASTPQKSRQPKASVMASLLRFTTAQGGGTVKSVGTTATTQKAVQSASPAKFTATQSKSALRTKQVAAKPKEGTLRAKQVAAKTNVTPPQLKSTAKANIKPPRLSSTPRASTTPPKLELLAYPTATLESAVTTVPRSQGLDATLVNEILSLQYRRCASSIDEQEVL